MTQQAVTTGRSRLRLRLKLFGEIVSELKKVVWLSRREIVYLTFLVLVISVGAGLLLGAFDLGFARLIDIFVGR